MLLKKPGQFAVGSATQSGAGLLDLNFLNSDATLSNTITHSRSGNATMVASDGLIKWAPHNLLTYSEQFDNAAWLDTSVDVDENVIAAPDGTMTADLFIPKAENNYHRLSQKPFSVDNKVTFGVWAKAGGYNLLAIREDSSTGSALVVDLSDGSTSVYEVGGVTVDNISITSAGSDWYYIQGSFYGASTVGFALLVLNPSYTSGPVTTAWTGDGTSGIYVWGAHLYRSDLGGMAPVPAGERVIPSASTYVPTTSSARYLPRVGHHVYNGSAWVNEGVLAESEARTNLLAYSNDFRNTADAGATRQWLYSGITLTPNDAVSPSGLTDADFVVETATTGAHQIYDDDIVLSASGIYTASFYIKPNGRNQISPYVFNNNGSGLVRVYYDLTDGSEVTTPSIGGANLDFVGSTIKSFSNGWYQVSLTVNATAAGNLDFGVGGYNAGTSYAGDITKGFYIYGAQFEAAPTPSSYIPTAGSTVTRAAETFTIPAANLPWSGTAVSIQMNGRMTYADEGDAISSIPTTGTVNFYNWPQDVNNYIAAVLGTEGADVGSVRLTQEIDSTYDAVISGSSAYTPGILVPFNVASRHGMTFINGAVDGVALTANTTPTNLPDLSATDLDLAYDYMGTVERFRIWGLDLGDDGIEDATTGEPASYLIWDQANDDYVQRIFQ